MQTNVFRTRLWHAEHPSVGSHDYMLILSFVHALIATRLKVSHAKTLTWGNAFKNDIANHGSALRSLSE